MSELIDRLNTIRDRTNAATDVPAMATALQKVLELHQPTSPAGYDICQWCADPEIAAYPMRWPCPTYRAIERALTHPQSPTSEDKS